jgi:hypothetical protein
MNNYDSKPFLRSVQHSLSPHPSNHTAKCSLCRLAAVSIRISRRCQHPNVSPQSTSEYLGAVSIRISRRCQHPNMSALLASEYFAAVSIRISRCCQQPNISLLSDPNISTLSTNEYLAASSIQISYHWNGKPASKIFV